MNDYISVSGNETYKTIDEAFENVFSSKNPQPMKGCFEPLPSFAGTELAGCHIWFPKLKPNDAGWENQHNGDEIVSRNANGKGKAEVGQKNIAFTHTGKEYVFAGIFELKTIDGDGTEHWKKINDKCLVIGRQK